jgi:hemolysin activation/secretion protein
LVLALVLSLAALPGGAQNASPSAERRPDLPQFESAADSAWGDLLPKADLTTASTVPESSQTGAAIYLRDLVVSGNHLLSTADIDRIRERYAGRPLGFIQLRDLRDEITRLYLERGYLTSGAVLPEQQYSDGVVRIDVVEGALDRIEVTTDGRLKPGYVRDYLGSFGNFDPVNVYDLERRLRFLQGEATVRRVDARLLPGQARGASNLEVQIEEASSWSLIAEANSYRNPAVGMWGAVLRGSMHNLIGQTDSLAMSTLGTQGVREFTASYELPVGSHGTRLAVRGLAARSKIVEAPFDHLDIKARAYTAALTLEQPVRRRLSSDTRLFLTAEWRKTESYLLGTGFSFAAGPDEGIARESVLRFGVEHTRRGARDVLAARVTASQGLGALDATVHEGRVPDGRFFAVLGQFQWARRFGARNNQIVTRLDAQVSDTALLGMEQMAIGGYATVRGYRENTLVRDRGVVASIELRLPLLPRPSGTALVELVPFVDFSRSWNRAREAPGPKSLGSAGLGIRFTPVARFSADVFWGYAFQDVDHAGESSLQDRGFHVGLRFGM